MWQLNNETAQLSLCRCWGGLVLEWNVVILSPSGTTLLRFVSFWLASQPWLQRTLLCSEAIIINLKIEQRINFWNLKQPQQNVLGYWRRCLVAMLCHVHLFLNGTYDSLEVGKRLKRMNVPVDVWLQELKEKVRKLWNSAEWLMYEYSEDCQYG